MSLLLLSVFAVSARSPLPDAESWCSSAIVLEADVVDASRSTATLAVVRTIKGRVEGEVRYEQPVGLAPLAVGDRVVVFASPHKRQASLVGEARPFVRNDSVTPPVMVAAAPAPLRRQVAVAALAPSPTAAVVHLYPQPVVAVFQPNLASLRAEDAAGCEYALADRHVFARRADVAAGRGRLGDVDP